MADECEDPCRGSKNKFCNSDCKPRRGDVDLTEPELEEYVRQPCMPVLPPCPTKPRTPEPEPEMSYCPCPPPNLPPCRFKPIPPDGCKMDDIE